MKRTNIINEIDLLIDKTQTTTTFAHLCYRFVLAYIYVANILFGIQ